METRTKKSPTPAKSEGEYKVIDPVIDTTLPSYPSTPITACKNLEDYLNKHFKEGYEFIGFMPQKIGRTARDLMVFRKVT